MAANDSDVVIIGVGETPVGRLHGMKPVEIQAWAAREAIADAGISSREVNGLINQTPYSTPNTMFATTLAEYAGLRTNYAATVDVGGTLTPMTIAQNAVWAIESGQCDTVLCAYGENLRSSRPADKRGMYIRNQHGAEEWEEPFGVHAPLAWYGMVAERYKYDFGATDADFGAVAVLHRNHALLNDNAVMKMPLTIEEYLASPIIWSPLRKLDCSIPIDGGGALILTTRAKARALGARAVSVRSLTSVCTHNGISTMPDITDLGIAEASSSAFEKAGIGPEDIDVLLLHDAFTISVLIGLEGLGLCQPGDGGAYLRSGAAGLGGKCPLNPHGGLLSQGHLGGMLHLIEAVRQLRGSAGRRQTEGARLAALSGNGGVFSICGTMILESAA